MIIKILQNQTSFAGIDYSERKNEQGKSELLAAENFGIVSEDMNKQSYIRYLTMIGNLNDRVKNKQFHAVISTKGKMHSFEQLAEVAKKYMKEMGYADNPYLVYGHNDTENNHVHIVSARVDKQGARIDPSFERIRTREFIKNELELSQGKSPDQVIAQTMRYSFSTTAQIRLLIEKENYIARENNGGIDLIKDGRVQNHIPKDSIEKAISNYTLEKAIINQHKEIFLKYSEGRSIKEFQSIMKKTFGMDIIYHHATKKRSFKNKDLSPTVQKAPYGYTIVDHKSMTVIKGSRIFPLKSLLSAKERPMHKQVIYDLIGKRLPKGSFKELGNRLQSYGYELKANGNIHDLSNGSQITRLDQYYLKKAKYFDRVNLAQSFTISSNTNKNAMAQLFFIKGGDIKVEQRDLTSKEKNKYKDVLAVAKNVGPLDERLKNEGIQIVQLGPRSYLIDHDKRFALDTEKDLEMSVDLARIRIVLPGKAIDIQELDKDHNPTTAKEFINNIASLVDDTADEAKKRKRINIFR